MLPEDIKTQIKWKKHKMKRKIETTRKNMTISRGSVADHGSGGGGGRGAHTVPVWIKEFDNCCPRTPNHESNGKTQNETEI